MGTIDKLKVAYKTEDENNNSKKFILLAVLTPLLSLLFVLFMTIIDINQADSKSIEHHLKVIIQVYISMFQPVLLITFSYWVFRKTNYINEFSKNSPFISSIAKILFIIKYNFISFFILITCTLIALPIVQAMTGLWLDFNFTNSALIVLIALLIPILSFPLLSVISILNRWMSKFSHYVIGIIILYFFNSFFVIVPFGYLTFYVNLQMVPLMVLEGGYLPQLTVFAIIATNIAVTVLVIYYLKRSERTDVALEG